MRQNVQIPCLSRAVSFLQEDSLDSDWDSDDQDDTSSVDLSTEEDSFDEDLFNPSRLDDFSDILGNKEKGIVAIRGKLVLRFHEMYGMLLWNSVCVLKQNIVLPIFVASAASSFRFYC